MKKLVNVPFHLLVILTIIFACAILPSAGVIEKIEAAPNIFDKFKNITDLIPDPNKIPIVDDLIKNNGLSWKIFRDGKRMVEVLNFTTPIGILRGEYCYMYGDMFIIDQLIKLVPFKTELTPEEMDALIDRCEEVQQKNMLKGSIIPQVIMDLPGGMFRRLFIFPGTRWCGAGDISRHYEHLGPAKETDKCCRTHDHCPENMAAGEQKNGLRNNGLYTKSHCDCDKKFYNCLQADGSMTSNAVGMLFFNILSTECYDLEHPLVCKKKFPPIIGKCVAYKLDKKKPKIWQFIVPKNYEVSGNTTGLDKIFKETF